MLAEADTVTVKDNDDIEGGQTFTRSSKKGPKELSWKPPEVKFVDIHNKLVSHSTFDEGHCGKIHDQGSHF